MSKKKLYLLIGLVALFFIILFVALYYFFWPEPQVPEVAPVKKIEELKFTHDIFDASKISFIAPLGELNGGYNETSPITGICVNNKGTKGVEIYAPADLTLTEYSFAGDGKNRADRHLAFQVTKDVKLSFDHITWVPDRVRAVTPPTQNSARVPVSKKISFKAGDLIAKTTGTEKAHNWNIYLTDKRHKNVFVNQQRYESVKDIYGFLNAACPFNYYNAPKKQQYLALMGATKAGQSKACGSTSKDVEGTISGLWHLSTSTDMSTFRGEYKGQYATPFSVYKDSAGRIVIYEINRERYIVGQENISYKDPATVQSEHCYNLTKYPGEAKKGYAYFKVVNKTEMKVAYSAIGSCPLSFPTNSVSFYR